MTVVNGGLPECAETPGINVASQSIEKAQERGSRGPPKA
jgi:hypothetical protein